MKQLFCYVYKFWLSKFVDSKDDFLVRFIDAAAGSECKYCMAVRTFILGLGGGLMSAVFYHYFFGLSALLAIIGIGLCVVVILMTLGEKHWLCKE